VLEIFDNLSIVCQSCCTAQKNVAEISYGTFKTMGRAGCTIEGRKEKRREAEKERRGDGETERRRESQLRRKFVG
jgi:hypothetical protein